MHKQQNKRLIYIGRELFFNKVKNKQTIFQKIAGKYWSDDLKKYHKNMKWKH